MVGGRSAAVASAIFIITVFAFLFLTSVPPKSTAAGPTGMTTETIQLIETRNNKPPAVPDNRTLKGTCYGPQHRALFIGYSHVRDLVEAMVNTSELHLKELRSYSYPSNTNSSMKEDPWITWVWSAYYLTNRSRLPAGHFDTVVWARGMWDMICWQGVDLRKEPEPSVAAITDTTLSSLQLLRARYPSANILLYPLHFTHPANYKRPYTEIHQICGSPIRQAGFRNVTIAAVHAFNALPGLRPVGLYDVYNITAHSPRTDAYFDGHHYLRGKDTWNGMMRELMAVTCPSQLPPRPIPTVPVDWDAFSAATDVCRHVVVKWTNKGKWIHPQPKHRPED